MAIKINPWFRTTLIATLGGGFASTFAGIMNHDKYHFPQDLGSGKLWENFVAGAAWTFMAVLVKSPIEPPAPPPSDDKPETKD